MIADCRAVIVTDITGEIVDPSVRDSFYCGIAPAERDLIWASWRKPTVAELISTWPAQAEPSREETGRGWWVPTLQELREARRKARSIERAAETRRRRT
jgi:hypothetical protein